METPTITDWPHLFRPGSDDSTVLLMLHGTGGNEDDIAGLGAQLDPMAGILAPRGPVTENGMRRWFKRHAEGVFDVDDVIARAGQLAGFLDSARETYSLGGRPVIAVGFSNGANIGLATALLHPEVLSRVVAFSGMYPLGDRAAPEPLPDTRMLILNGDRDPMAPLASVRTLVAEAQERGAAVQQVVRFGGHGIEPSEITAAREWLGANATA
jgi:phospholipase/carboxylesterase